MLWSDKETVIGFRVGEKTVNKITLSVLAYNPRSRPLGMFARVGVGVLVIFVFCYPEDEAPFPARNLPPYW